MIDDDDDEPQPQPTIRLLVLTAYGNARVDTFPNTAEALSKIVGGYLESFPLPSQLRDRYLIGLCDADGKLVRNKMFNVYSPFLQQDLVGDIVIVKTEGPEFVDITDEDIEEVSDLLDPQQSQMKDI